VLMFCLHGLLQGCTSMEAPVGSGVLQI